MDPNPSCPVCASREWRSVGERSYRADRADVEGLRARALRVLFERWAPGRATFRVEFVGCERCGMMIYRPRPTAADLDAKYGAYAEEDAIVASSGEADERKAERQARMFSLVAPRLPRPVSESRILDFGGGDGRLLVPFLEAGARCDVVDYCETPVDGVRHVGHTQDDLGDERIYDAAICAHVVEHLADPAPVLRRLARVLRPDGVIYVEVPVEMIGRLPCANEPVTHVNFFTPESLAALLRASGFRVESSRLGSYPHPRGGFSTCASAFGRPGQERSAFDGIDMLRRYLAPSPAVWVRAQATAWRDLPRRAIKRLSRGQRADG